MYRHRRYPWGCAWEASWNRCMKWKKKVVFRAKIWYTLYVFSPFFFTRYLSCSIRVGLNFCFYRRHFLCNVQGRAKADYLLPNGRQDGRKNYWRLKVWLGEQRLCSSRRLHQMTRQGDTTQNELAYAGDQQLPLALTLAIRLTAVQVASLPPILSLQKRTSHTIFLAICELTVASF